MTADAVAVPSFADVDDAMSSWRQGDCTLGEQWFAYRILPERPLTENSHRAVSQDASAYLPEEKVLGFAVLTQTCDVVRTCTARPYVEVCPLVEVDEHVMSLTERGEHRRYAYIPMMASRNLVADLDRTMTVEKPVVAQWERMPGWSTDAEIRAFAETLTRKRSRFAFPDDFTALAGKLQKRLREKHDKGTPEGDALRALREVRIQASPSWDEPSVTLTFWFIRRDDDLDHQGKDWSIWLESWLQLVPTSGRFTKVQGQVFALEDLTAADYVGSDRLDLDHLSSRVMKK